MKELSKAYNPGEHEKAIYQQWLRSNYFNPDKLPDTKKRKPFTISMPPPNATGELHLGHAVMVALEDLMIRFERMRGRKTLWVPGTDHAAIATNAVVEKELKKEGLSKKDLGREKFLQRVDQHVATTQGRMREQIERMGASCDWDRERFTLDEGLSVAVRTAFVEMYDDGLIYRGTKVVNWCPHCQSTLADDEVEYKEQQTTLATFRYDKNFPISIATTRPETKFGDTAVAVHPSDERYKQYIGKEFPVNFAGVARTIKIVTEHSVDKDYGTGALGVTPAHSSIDEAIAQREHLPSIVVIDKNGRMTKEAGEYAGLKVKEAREKVLAWLKEQGLLEHEETITHNLSVCYRCGTAIEPMPLEQWFVAVDKPTKKLDGKSLKQRALAVLEKEEIAFVPDRFASVYKRWMENLHDWCISRQIWYGHAIPIWYKGSEVYAGTEQPKGDGPATKLSSKEGGIPPNGGDWTQDPDTLDTWFSASLWTFSTLGWPEKTSDLKEFHPTDVMETGYDIIFFWVARMIMMSTYFVQEVPFKTVYLHGLVRDQKGRKMSKSLGNGIDPLLMADKYGADAVRLSLIIGTTPGNDQKLSEEKIASFRNYANKLWNIGRFLQMQEQSSEKPKVTTLADQWITSKLESLVEQTTQKLEHFMFSQAGEALYEFAWHDFADWYLEITKVEQNVALAQSIYRTVLELLHPFMPFVTETLWSELGYGKELLMVEPWPQADRSRIDENAEQEFAKLQHEITELRKEKKAAADLGTPALELKRPADNIVWQYQELVEKLVRTTLKKTNNIA